MKANWLMVLAVCAAACAATVLPATADDAGEIVIKHSGNTPECPASCDGCGRFRDGHPLGDLLVVGVSLMGLAALRAVHR